MEVQKGALQEESRGTALLKSMFAGRVRSLQRGEADVPKPMPS